MVEAMNSSMEGVMGYVVAATVILLGLTWYIGYVYGMAVMADQLEDQADQDANPDANE